MKVHAHEVHAYEVHAHEVHAYKVHILIFENKFCGKISIRAEVYAPQYIRWPTIGSRHPVPSFRHNFNI